MSKLDTAVQAALKDVNGAAMKQIADNKASLGVVVNGWVVTEDLALWDKLYEASGGSGVRLACQSAT